MPHEVSIPLPGGRRLQMSRAQAAELVTRCAGGAGRTDTNARAVRGGLKNRKLLDRGNEPTELGRQVAALLEPTTNFA